jgi:hypothetical protein
MEGTTGAETEIFGASGKLIVGTDGVESGRFIIGTETVGTLFTWMEGVPGRRMVGIGAGTSFESDRVGMFLLWPSAGPYPGWARISGFTSACFGFQFVSKLTIGRPGLSLTAVGVGSFWLRSFRRMLVACRISSFLISRPFLVGVSGRGASATGTTGFAV